MQNSSYLTYVAEFELLVAQMKSNKVAQNVRIAESFLNQAVARQKPILICGNGGSAADALHIAGELSGRFFHDRRPIKALALVADVACLTAIANDYAYEKVFSRQVEAHGEHDGVLVAISTSGNSKNVLFAAESARKIGMKIISMTGTSGGALEEKSDICIKIPSASTPLIQQGHQIVYHHLCASAEQAILRAYPDRA